MSFSGQFLPASTQIAVLLVLCLESGFCQGTVNFANAVNFASSADRLVRDVTGVPLTGSNYFAQLYYGRLNAPAESLVAVTAAPATFSLPGVGREGRWFGGMRTLTGFSDGQTVTLQVRVWDSAAGPTWEVAAQNGFAGTQYGQSEVFSYSIPITGPPQAWFIENFRGFTLVPEPSVIGLAIIGAAVLLFVRRYK